LLTAQTVAWLRKESLPMPAAVGMLCAAGAYFGEGDTGHLYAARARLPLAQIADPRENVYFREADRNDPLAFPVRSQEILARFPPSLLISATRDFGLSSVGHMHSLLTGLGVEADLHVWEGLDHAFHYWPDLPQSRAVYRVVARFFEKHLAP
jgi:acetyl esterase/lipase